MGGSLSPLHMLRPLVFAKTSSTNCLFLAFVALIWKRPPLVSNFQYSAWLSIICVFICKIVTFFFHILYKFDFLEVSSVKSKNGFFSYNFCNVWASSPHYNILSHVPQKGADSTKNNFVSNEFHPPHVLCNKFFHSKSLQMFFLTGSDVFFFTFSKQNFGSKRFWFKQILGQKTFGQENFFGKIFLGQQIFESLAFLKYYNSNLGMWSVLLRLKTFGLNQLVWP